MLSFIEYGVSPAKRLSRSFYQRDTIDVARDLIGKTLVHRPSPDRQLAGMIVETEAYLGLEDPAAHSYGGRRTARTEPMFGQAGLSYVYFIYGVYFCFNVVTQTENIPEAVLIRALTPVDGAQFEANGPGKLCRALNLARTENALDLCTNDRLWIEDRGMIVEESQLVDGPRVGIGLEMDHIHWPLRFGLRNHPALSRPRFPEWSTPP